LSIHSTGLGDDQPLGASPLYCSIGDWVKISGLSRSVVYELLGRGAINAVKFNSKTLIDVQSGLAYLRSLPRAEITTGRRRTESSRPAEG
jgi:hypothetical protein